MYKMLPLVWPKKVGILLHSSIFCEIHHVQSSLCLKDLLILLPYFIPQRGSLENLDKKLLFEVSVQKPACASQIVSHMWRLTIITKQWYHPLLVVCSNRMVSDEIASREIADESLCFEQSYDRLKIC